MKFISHRGNLNCPKEDMENSPAYVEKALKEGFDVEIDLRIVDGVVEDKYYLGHDGPQYRVDKDFVLQEGLWIHAKNVYTLCALLDEGKGNFFVHNVEEAVLTSNGYIWTLIGKPLTSRSIAVLPEKGSYSLDRIITCAGVCSDYISIIRNILS